MNTRINPLTDPSASDLLTLAATITLTLLAMATITIIRNRRRHYPPARRRSPR